jgi:hypothetical protein
MVSVWKGITFFILGVGVLIIIGVIAGFFWALLKGTGILS